MGIILKDTNGGKLKALLKVLMSAFQTMNNTFYSYVSSKRNELQYNAQKIYLQRMLNDYFDAVGRGIYLVNVINVYSKYVYNKNEGFGDYLYDKSEGLSNYYLNKSEPANENQFIAYVPSTVVFDENYMRSLIDSYVFAGAQYEIITF